MQHSQEGWEKRKVRFTYEYDFTVGMYDITVSTKMLWPSKTAKLKSKFDLLKSFFTNALVQSTLMNAF